ncbi:hypothetical protein J5N97_022864 [Dioscorea zingiberensis]|uniref:Uncharacterized protein n=1 Tax=Dioscorea zingiberensis TaxID=325984 RepID=A0A9D5CCF1_9LILI|nr:hypothetical protein J5N97_022864 [Dioscorea zingiberensis]
MELLVPELHSDGKFNVQGILEDNSFDNNTSCVLDSLVDLSKQKVEFGGTNFGEPIQLAYIYLPSDHIDLKAAADARLTVAHVIGIAEMTGMNVIPLMTEQLIALAVAIHDNIKEGGPIEIDTKLLHQFANGSGVILTSLASIFGGTIGQEVVKACFGKLHPLHQFFYIDFVVSLSVDTLNPGEVEPQFCRYDDQIGVFGYKLQKKLEDAKVFIVGSGTLGCEFLMIGHSWEFAAAQKGS